MQCFSCKTQTRHKGPNKGNGTTRLKNDSEKGVPSQTVVKKSSVKGIPITNSSFMYRLLRSLFVQKQHLYSVFLTNGQSKHFTILPNILPFMHTFTHRRRCQPRGATASRSGSVRVRASRSGTPRHSSEEEPGIEPATFRLPADPEQHAALIQGAYRVKEQRHGE